MKGRFLRFLLEMRELPIDWRLIISEMSTQKSLLNGTILANFTLIHHRTKIRSNMKTKYAIMLLTMGMSAAAMAQDDDDMYFNSKDRAKANQENNVVLAKRYQQ